ncbi:MAG: VWA domain-containing protein [Ruminococcaceae bacterium]|nr:VWA domain-containing protein [Oscillospiraceae bacterium]
MGLIDLGKTLRASTRPLDIIYVIDTSWSMGGRKIEAVNRAMHELERLLCDEAKKNPLADVKVRILAFNNEKAYWHLKERTSAESFKYDDIVSVEGGTPFGSALDKIAEALSDNDSIRGLPPIIVVMSDGWPTDAWEVSLERLLSTPWGKKATKIAIAIGKEPDKEILAQFTGDPSLVLTANDTGTLVEYIKWSSTLVSQVSQLFVGDGTGNTTRISVPEPLSMIMDDTVEII